jgi:ELWxxDGT repeat protein
MLIKRIIVLAYIISLFGSAIAQTPDIKNYEVKPGVYGSSPIYFTEFKSKLYFSAWDSTHGYELWRIDTATGLNMVADINPGRRDGTAYNTGGSPSLLPPGYTPLMDHFAVAVNNTGTQLLFFMGNNGSDSFQLYQYDGVAAPTKAKDIIPVTGLRCNGFTTLNNKVYFYNSNVASQDSIWEYDPVTGLKRTIFGGISNAGYVNMVAYKNKLYFGVNPTSNSGKLYCYDPSTGNVSLIKNWGGLIVYMSAIGNYLYINNTLHLYQYDTSMTEPQSIGDVCSSSPVPTWPVGTLNSKVYYSCPGNNGHCKVCEFDPSSSLTKTLENAYDPASFVELNSRLFFSATDSASGNNFYKYSNHEIWQYDGINNPYELVDINDDTSASQPCFLTVFANSIYMAAEPSSHNTKINPGSPTNPISRYEIVRFKPNFLTVQKLSFQADVHIYPNPTEENVFVDLNLNSPTVVEITVKDLTGKIVTQFSGQKYPSGRTKVNIHSANWPAGMYICSIRNADDKMVYSSQIVKR